MKVVGIDPAPKKGTTIYDPASESNEGWSTVDACKLPGHISQLINENGDLLICWDAPLTAGKAGHAGCFYERPIERFFQTQKGWTVPKGISIRAYAGCPHWAVTRAAVGLPRVGEFDSPNLPLNLLAEGNAPQSGKHIVEVHPAVAIWLWCQATQPVPSEWIYKKDKGVRETLWQAMVKDDEEKPKRPPNDDDEFDAYVAYLLGSRWLNNSSVLLLGGQSTGSFLIPKITELQAAFQCFRRNLK